MTTQTLVLQLAPAPRRTRVWLWLLFGALPTVGAAWLFGHLFSQGSVSQATALFGFASAVLPALAIGMVSKQMRGHRLVLRARDVGVVSGAHRQLLSYAELELERARVLDLDEVLEFKPRLKTNGVSLPGFQTGWYRLRNGSRALVARAGGKRVLWIPTTRDFALLLQPDQSPREVLQKLREAAEGAGSGGGLPFEAAAQKRYWFPAKQLGWGWGIPTAWQGWVVLGLFIAGMSALPRLVPEDRYLIGVAVLIALLILVCVVKGEPPRWRWGNEDEY